MEQGLYAVKSSKSLDVFKSKIRQLDPIELATYVRITCDMSVSSSFSILTVSKALQT